MFLIICLRVSGITLTRSALNQNIGKTNKLKVLKGKGGEVNQRVKARYPKSVKIEFYNVSKKQRKIFVFYLALFVGF
jgi:hypothetical protein